MIGGHSGRGRWRGQEGRAFQRRETGKKEADVHGMRKSAEGKPVAMVQGNWQGSSREGWRGKPCRAGGSGSTEKAAGGLPNAIARGKWREHTPRHSAGKAIKECPEGGRAQGKRREGDWALPRRKIGKKRGWGMRHGETNGRALESGGAGKPTERRPEGAVQKNRQAGDESDSAGKPQEGNRERRHGKGNRSAAEGGWRGNPHEQTARK